MDFEHLLFSLWEHADVNMSGHCEGTEYRVKTNSQQLCPLGIL